MTMKVAPTVAVLPKTAQAILGLIEGLRERYGSEGINAIAGSSPTEWQRATVFRIRQELLRNGFEPLWFDLVISALGLGGVNRDTKN